MADQDDDLASISARTLAYYDRAAEPFSEGTLGHDVTQNYEAFLRYIEAAPPLSILDLGCGPGRDLRHFDSLGHEAVGLDGSSRFVQMARDYSGCEVLHQDFLCLELAAERYDGVFANASLFHIPRRALPRVLGELRAALRPRGVLFSSNPRGDNREGWSGDRYGSFHDLEQWRELVTQAGFDELTHYYRPTGLPRARQPWLASVWRKVG
jgi:SAM-dependent methyltransferase